MSFPEDYSKKIDMVLRRRILEVVDAVKATGGVRGTMLLKSLEDLPEQVQGHDHLMGLCQDLINSGLLRIADIRTRRDEPFGLKYLMYYVTAEGTALLAEQIPPCPLVDDERIVPKD